MKKLIFLDFDGVIATEKSRYKLDKEKLALLKIILAKTDASIVISSSWRRNTVEETINDKAFINFPFKDKVIGVTIRAYHYCKGTHLSIPRGVEIKQWIDTNIHSENGKNWEYKRLGVDYNYVILDDDSDMLLEQREHFVKTDSRLGINSNDSRLCISILNK